MINGNSNRLGQIDNLLIISLKHVSKQWDWHKEKTCSYENDNTFCIKKTASANWDKLHPKIWIDQAQMKQWLKIKQLYIRDKVATLFLNTSVGNWYVKCDQCFQIRFLLDQTSKGFPMNFNVSTSLIMEPSITFS